MTAARVARIFGVLAALSSGVALGALAFDQTAWFAGALIAALIAVIASGLAAAIAKPDEPQSGHVIWRTTPPFGVERVITPAPVTTELAYRPPRAIAAVPGGQEPLWVPGLNCDLGERFPSCSTDDEHRPIWHTDIFGAPE